MAIARTTPGRMATLVLLALTVTMLVTVQLAQAQQCGPGRRPCPARLQCVRGNCRRCTIPRGSPKCGGRRLCPPGQDCVRRRCRICRIAIPSDLYMPSEYIKEQFTDPATYSVIDQVTDPIADEVMDPVTDLDMEAVARRRCGRHRWCPLHFCCRRGFCQHYRDLNMLSDDVTDQVTDQATDPATEQVEQQVDAHCN